MTAATIQGAPTGAPARRRAGRPRKTTTALTIETPIRPCHCPHCLPLADDWYGPAWVRCLLCGHDVLDQGNDAVTRSGPDPAQLELEGVTA